MRTYIYCLLVAAGCQGGAEESAETGRVSGESTDTEDGGSGVRWDTASAWESDGDDVSDGPQDLVPAHSLRLTEELRWTGAAGDGLEPGSALAGSLLVVGTLDGTHPLCAARFALSGVVEEEPACETCSLRLATAYTLELEGPEVLAEPEEEDDPTDDTGSPPAEDTAADSGSPDTGAPAEELVLPELGGLAACPWPEQPASGDTRTLAWAPSEGAAWLDYGGAGLWMSWYAAEVDEDDLVFGWSQTFAFTLPEEED